jgi:hypothetical protein
MSREGETLRLLLLLLQVRLPFLTDGCTSLALMQTG